MSSIERHRQRMRLLRGSPSEAATVAADIVEGQRREIRRLQSALADETKQRETAERQVRDQAREIERLRRDNAELRSRV